ncbi:MAG TPA: hypothetical protein VNU64_20480 [Burkholderiales bacterium]|nr:hypothetical protein [Burkholderiales bacterium]
MREPGDIFVAAVCFVFGVLAWLQMPAVCGFMLSSTLRGAGNYLYSIWLGLLIAIVGLAAGLPSLLRHSRHGLLLAGMVLGAGFIVFAALGRPWYDQACHAIYAEFPLPPSD